MSYLIDLKNKRFNTLYVINQELSKYDHAYWRVYCSRCHRYDITSTNVLYNRDHKRCSRCFKTRFDYNTSLEIVKKLDDGYKKIDICEEYRCSYKAVATAIRMVKDAEHFNEVDKEFEVFNK